jgi:hypothetical protein
MRDLQSMTMKKAADGVLVTVESVSYLSVTTVHEHVGTVIDVALARGATDVNISLVNYHGIDDETWYDIRVIGKPEFLEEFAPVLAQFFSFLGSGPGTLEKEEV